MNELCTKPLPKDIFTSLFLLSSSFKSIRIKFLFINLPNELYLIFIPLLTALILKLKLL